MGWSYSENPDEVPVDAVRLLVGDTNAEDPLISDEEISFALSEQGGNVYHAAADAADIISAKFTRAVDINVEGLGASFSRRSQAFAELAIRLRTMARNRRGRKYTRFLDEQFTTRPPAFDVGMHDYQRHETSVVDD